MAAVMTSQRGGDPNGDAGGKRVREKHATVMEQRPEVSTMIIDEETGIEIV
jgi:hypothetical protein